MFRPVDREQDHNARDLENHHVDESRAEPDPKSRRAEIGIVSRFDRLSPLSLLLPGSGVIS